MSDLNDFFDKDSFDFLCNNKDQINSGGGDVDISADEHTPIIVKKSTGYGQKIETLVFKVFCQ